MAGAAFEEFVDNKTPPKEEEKGVLPWIGEAPAPSPGNRSDKLTFWGSAPAPSSRRSLVNGCKWPRNASKQVSRCSLWCIP